MDTETNTTILEYVKLNEQIKTLSKKADELKAKILEAHGYDPETKTVKTELLESENCQSKITFGDRLTLNLKRVKEKYNIDLDKKNEEAKPLYDATHYPIIKAKMLIVEG